MEEKQLALEMSTLLPKRKRDSHKGCYGKAAIVAGSKEYTGAAYLAAVACLRTGVGYTTLFVPENILPYYILKAPEALLKPFAFKRETWEGLLAYDSIAYGMGMGVSESVARCAVWLIGHYEGKLILDADGLNSLVAYCGGELTEIFARKKCDVVITPHIKEFSRLTSESASTFAKKHKINVLLKSAVSVIANERETWRNETGNSGQAKAGTGDVLSGVIAGLCATGLSGFDGARLGAYLVGKTAEIAVKDIGEYSLVATDLIAYLGKAFLYLTRITENTDKKRDEE